MRGPAPEDQPRAGVQQHDEARGEASRHRAPPGAHGQVADQTRTHVVVGQAELVLRGTKPGGHSAGSVTSGGTSVHFYSPSSQVQSQICHIFMILYIHDRIAVYAVLVYSIYCSLYIYIFFTIYGVNVLKSISRCFVC